MKFAVPFLFFLSLAVSVFAAPPQGSSGNVSISSTERMLIQMLLSDESFGPTFMERCTAEADSLLGTKQSKETCVCAFNHLVRNDTLLYLLMKSMDANGEIKDFGPLGMRLLSPCLPPEFTPEMEKSIEDECLRVVRGGNRSRCKCAYKHIKKNYTVKSLLEEISMDREKLRLKLVGLVGRCVVP
ncbi:MAG: hypothetical protein IKC23_08265 [Fibrobacter sp.]|nr:hypothetical protein [Fibrobacter sp.]